jgi:hypothetical protein
LRGDKASIGLKYFAARQHRIHKAAKPGHLIVRVISFSFSRKRNVEAGRVGELTHMSQRFPRAMGTLSRSANHLSTLPFPK